jgi:4-amino-4-deoxy-L-arabinose transferase-like glycosyltransferase
VPIPQPASGPVDPPGLPPLARSAGLAAILLLAAGLRCAWLDAVVGGFHSHNEGHYVLIAKNFFHGSPLRPTPDEGRTVFLETPPLYSYILHAVFRVTGVSVLAARLVSIVSSLALVLAAFFFSRKLFGESAGLWAALIVAVSPVAVLTGRNIQTDSTMLLFVVAALFFYRRADDGSRADRIRSGLFAGLALFTKLAGRRRRSRSCFPASSTGTTRFATSPPCAGMSPGARRQRQRFQRRRRSGGPSASKPSGHFLR